MAASGYTPISLYYSTTPSAVPTGTNLVYGELAINIADGKLYYKNSSNVVTLFSAANPATLTISSPLSGTSYDGSSPVTIALASGYGDTQNPYASKTQNFVLAAPNGSSGVPTFRALVAADIPALNYVSSVSGSGVISSSGGLTPTISISQAGASTSGFLSSTDWNTFNNKQPAGTYVTSISVASSNGFAGSSSGGATPTITLSTSITGLLQGNGTAISAVTVGSGLSFSGGTLSNSLPMVYPGSGIAVSTGSAWGTSLTAPSGAIVGTTDTQTLTNKRITLRTVSITSAATITPTSDTCDQYNITALATTAVFAAPSGTPTDGQKLTIRIEDSGSGQSMSWTTTSGGYRVIGTTLPTSIAAGKTIYVGCIWNSNDSFWDVVSVATQA